MADPEHPERQELLEWLGEPFAPDAFSADRLNSLLRCLKL